MKRCISFIFLSLLMQAMPALSAHAASFECSKAVQPQEKLICNDAGLSALDVQMAVNYRKLMGSLSPGEAQSDLRSGQREWLAYWSRACEAENGRLPVSGEDTIECATEEYGQRIEELKALPPLFGDLPVYTIARYRIVRSDGGVGYIRYAKDSMRYQRIDMASVTAARKPFAEAIQFWLDYTRTMDTDAEIDSSSDLEFAEELLPVVWPHLLSVSEGAYFYGHGAAHGSANVSYRHFNVSEMRSLRVSDVFQGNDWQNALSLLVEKDLKRQFEDGYYLDSFHKLRELAIDPSRWQFGKNGLTLQFNPYEVAPYAAGMPVSEIPWSELSPYLTKGFVPEMK